MKITLCYIYPNIGPDHDDYALRFVLSYNQFQPGCDHETLIILNNGKATSKTRSLFECIGNFPNVSYLERGNNGWDIGGYQDAAKRVRCDAMLCLGESVYFHRAGWLNPLVGAWNNYGAGMYGPFASNEKRPHLNTTAFMCSPSLLLHSPKAESHDDRYQFEHGDKSCWRVAHTIGLPVKMVTWSGCYGPSEWRDPPDILRRGNQSNCLMWCNHTDTYADSDPNRRRILESATDGHRKIAVFYHARLSGGNPAVNSEHSIAVMRKQMTGLTVSGLLDAADDVYIGLNGDPESRNEFNLGNDAKIHWIFNGECNSERKTLIALKQFAAAHPNWLICYFHLKGAKHPNDKMVDAWRKCMETHVIYNWKKCVDDLNSGKDSAGAHWLTKEKYGGWMRTPFWGGNFWWATASFINTTEPLADNIAEIADVQIAQQQGGYDLETWIGKPRVPNVRDYAPHWPGESCMK